MTQDTETTTHDETAAAYFKSGWNAAVREVALQRQHGRLDEFMREQRPDACEIINGPKGHPEFYCQTHHVRTVSAASCHLASDAGVSR